MNHQALIERSHKQAVDKGFWEQPLTFDMAMALIISEIAEALEAYRKGKVTPDWDNDDAVKESFEVELADAIIRVYDWAGGNNLSLTDYKEQVTWTSDEGNNLMWLFNCVGEAWVRTRDDQSNMNEGLNFVLFDLLSYCKFKNIDIEKYIMWKLDYNLTRAYKHGKQF
jgi:NTP pyrophosphatase (non-canonical NTP hydrolase)